MRLSVLGVTTSSSEKHQEARIPEGKNTQIRSAIKRNDRPCGSEIQQFQMNATGVYPNDAMLRQISEGIKINNVDEDSLINSKNEWNYFQIPRAVITHGRLYPTEMRCLVRTYMKSEKAWTFLMSLT